MIKEKKGECVVKRLACLLLAAMLLLSGCGSSSAAPSGEDREPLSVSMEAAPVMGRSYVPQVPLPEAVTPMDQGGETNIWKAAETTDGQAALYNLDSGTGAVLLEWDGTLVMFDGWHFRTPQPVPPRMELLPQGVLMLDLYTGSGTGVSVEELHLIVKDEHGAMTDYVLPPSLYQDRLAALMTAETGKRSGSVSIGNLTLHLPEQEAKLTGGPCLGNIVRYETGSDGTVYLSLGIGMELKDRADPVYVGEVLCQVGFDNAGVYTLSGFALRE